MSCRLLLLFCSVWTCIYDYCHVYISIALILNTKINIVKFINNLLLSVRLLVLLVIYHKTIHALVPIFTMQSTIKTNYQKRVNNHFKEHMLLQWRTSTNNTTSIAMQMLNQKFKTIANLLNALC